MSTSLLVSSLRLSPFLPSRTEATGQPWHPTEPQAAYLLLDDLEVLYGGAAGGGKSDAMLAAALQYVDVPGYAALILRRSYPDLAKPGAIMDRAKSWLAPHMGAGTVRWVERDKMFVFPSGARLTFGYLAGADDRLQYQSAEYQFVGFDELTQFRESDYRYLFSRIRKPEGMPVPLRMRAASNPGGPGHEWVKLRWNLGVDELGHRFPPLAERVFIPALLADNPYLDHAAYLAALDQLDPIERLRLVAGDWGARPPGEMFHREWFMEPDRLVDVAPAGLRWVRRWDLAGTKKRKTGNDPDFTAGGLMGWDPRPTERLAYVADMIRAQDTPGSIAKVILATAALDRQRYGRVAVRMEQEPGSSGVAVIEAYQKLLAGYDFAGVRSTGSKSDRAVPFARHAEAGLVRTVRGPWVPDWIAELEAFPQEAVHDDQVDATSGAFLDLAGVGLEVSRSAPARPTSEMTGRSIASNPYHATRGRLSARLPRTAA